LPVAADVVPLGSASPTATMPVGSGVPLPTPRTSEAPDRRPSVESVATRIVIPVLLTVCRDPLLARDSHRRHNTAPIRTPTAATYVAQINAGAGTERTTTGASDPVSHGLGVVALIAAGRLVTRPLVDQHGRPLPSPERPALRLMLVLDDPPPPRRRGRVSGRRPVRFRMAARPTAPPWPRW
jgi:hypothetical protein